MLTIHRQDAMTEDDSTATATTTTTALLSSSSLPGRRRRRATDTSSASTLLEELMFSDFDSSDRDSIEVPPLAYYEEEKKENDLSSPQVCVRLKAPCRPPPASSSSAAASPAPEDDGSSPSPPRRGRLRKSVGVLFTTMMATLLITCVQTSYLNETYEQIKFQIRFSFLVVRSIYNLVMVNRRKKSGLATAAAAAPLLNRSSSSSSSWPDPPLDLFQNSTKLIWAYWHSGEENLCPLCQVSLQSWRAQHPTWTIIILSDTNYPQYIPPHHIPSTFDYLKVQFRSDIVRLSVLARYGGAYLDMTTVLFKSLDGIWTSELDRVKQQQEEKGGMMGVGRIFVPTVLELGTSTIDRVDDDDDDTRQQQLSTAVGLVTNSVILSPTPNNPILLKFLERILQYSEHPASTATELKSRPEFTRVQHLMNNKHVGILGKDGTLLYCAHLWIFTDLVLFDKEMKAGQYFVDLPALRWTYDFIMLPHVWSKFVEENKNDISSSSSSSCDDIKTASSASSCSSHVTTTTTKSIEDLSKQLQNERIQSWDAFYILKRALWGMIPWQEFDNPHLANYFLQDVVMFKTSTDGGTLLAQMSYDELMNMNSSFGRLYRLAVQGTGMNATLEGARPFGYGAPIPCSFELDGEC